MRSVCGGPQVTSRLRALEDGAQRSFWLIVWSVRLRDKAAW